MNNHLNDLAHWYPLLQTTGVQTPRTTIIHHEVDLSPLLEAKRPVGLTQLVAHLQDLAEQPTLGGYPLFFRTGQCSGKHDWENTCFVRSPDDIEECLCNLVEYSAECGFFGLPTDTLVLREMLPTQPAFHAFRGRMPIAREFRFFFNDKGIVGHWQPYWPPDSIREPSCEDWRDKLDDMSNLTAVEQLELRELTQRVAKAFPGQAWCVDWLWTSRGWYATDMALASDAFRWDPETGLQEIVEEGAKCPVLIRKETHDLGGEG